MKVKSKNITEKDLADIKQIQINKAKIFLQSAPFATPVYLAMKTNLSLKFILNNRKEIGV